ncbi:MAG: dTDP-4-dehydrorhamnose 3,5-epimerase [Xanthobacteraceae bacterium]|nr:MAG: dTDP-4-dehydrorhamnose 3,5-epimerase [Xanthobacteraceae bacterium]
MKATPTAIPEVMVFEPRLFADDRGFFFESFNQERFAAAVGRAVTFVQDNHSRSVKGVVRGIHYQLAPKAQGKLIRVVHGEIFDVAVDLRRASPTFGRWVGEILSAANRRQLWIPEGFGHAFQTLSDAAEVLYKTTDYWSREHERGILWDDAAIGIRWPGVAAPLLSPKDAAAPTLAQAELFGT